jgi:subtilase family serine protease
MLEPKPWYQQSEPTPASYPNGRMEPDLVLQAGVDPATYIVAMGEVGGIGGTSESSPLLAGLLALVAQASGGKLGLVTPTLYSIGNNPSEKSKVFVPTPIGYTVPFVASKGYNLASGWGAPNIGELAQYYQSAGLHQGLNVFVSVENPETGYNDEFTSGQTVQVEVTITNGASRVTAGDFSADIETVGGTSASVPLSYDGTTGNWTASLTMGGQSGVAFLNVEGNSGGVSGEGLTEFFAGYLATFLSPVPTEAWTTLGGLYVTVTAADINGNPAPPENIPMDISSYNILTNLYTVVGTQQLLPVPGGAAVNLTNAYPTGPIDLTLQGDTYGYLPFQNGIFLQTTEIFPPVAAEPGAVAPGQSLLILAIPEAPNNIANAYSFETGQTLGLDIAQGSNVTASLVSPTGKTVASTSVVMQPCDQFVASCTGGIVYNGELQVPSDASPGLYTVLLTANYTAVTIETDFGAYGVNGSFFGQVMVTGPASVQSVAVSPSTLYEGEAAKITADIRYSNGTETKFGEYSAFVYPQEVSSLYTEVNNIDYQLGYLIQLSYSPTLNKWVGSFTTPSPYSNSTIAPITGFTLDYSGPYDAFVTGHSYDGVPTDTDVSTQQAFFVQPYTLVANQSLSSLSQTSGLAFNGDTITASTSLSNDIFLGSNVIRGGTVELSDSSIQGTLSVNDSQLSLVSVSGGAISALNSQLHLADSSIGSLSLNGSSVSLDSSSYQSISPSLPNIQVQEPAGSSPYHGTLNVTAVVEGQQVSSVSFSIDGALIQTFAPASAPYVYAVNTSELADGVHSLTVTVVQRDGISSGLTTSFSTNAQAMSSANRVDIIIAQIKALDATIASLSSRLSNTNASAGTLYDISYGLAVAVVAIIIAFLVLHRKQTGTEQPLQAAPSSANPPTGTT